MTNGNGNNKRPIMYSSTFANAMCSLIYSMLILKSCLFSLVESVSSNCYIFWKSIITVILQAYYALRQYLNTVTAIT